MGKGRGGYGGFGGGMPNMKQIQQLQKQAMKMQKEMEEATAELEEQTVSAAAGGGVVEVTVSGKKEITAIKIEKEAVDPDDVEMLQDLIMAAVNQALRESETDAQNSMGRITGGMSGMGGLGGFGL